MIVRREIASHPQSVISHLSLFDTGSLRLPCDSQLNILGHRLPREYLKVRLMGTAQTWANQAFVKLFNVSLIVLTSMSNG